MLLTLWLACGGGDADGTGADTPPSTADTSPSPATDSSVSTGDSSPGPAPAEHRFSFVVVADPHISSNVEHEVRLAAAVDWINQHTVERRISFVAVVGDVGWGAGLPVAKALLDDLDVPYLPLLGDNEIATDHEEAFADTFAPQYERLATQLDGFTRGPVEVANPIYGQDSWFQNFAFDHGGMHFVGLDWCSRNRDDFFYAELAELHDFDGGTFPWYQAELSELPLGPDENVVLFSHHPMTNTIGGFVTDDWDQIIATTSPVAERVAAGFAGHLHVDWEELGTDAGYDVFVTDATWDDENTVRVVEVWSDDERFELRQELVLVGE